MTSFDSANVAPIHLERHEHLPSEYALRVRTIESLLAEKGLVDLAMERKGSRDHHTAGHDHVGNGHACRQVETSQAAKRFVPAAD